tara:strand:- start:6986 stop:9148 length:2163 start_codon:yes stop_codon:yes gene_type:complete
MKRIVLLFIVLIISIRCFAQVDTLNKTDMQKLKWGEYYFVNNYYDKSINIYESFDKELPSNAIKILSRAYFKSGKNTLALDKIKKIIDTPKADVEDYYFISQLLDIDPDLSKEYIEKANLLPLNKNKSKVLDTASIPVLNYKFNNVSINSPGTEFGGYLLPVYDLQGHILDETKVFYLSKQIDKRTKKLKNRINSDDEIYDLYQGELNITELDILNGKPLKSEINSIFQEGPIAIDSELKELYISRSSTKKDSNNKIQVDLYRARYDTQLNGFPIPLEINIDGYSTMHPSINLKEQRLYFSSDRPGGFGGMDLYYIPLSQLNHYPEVVNLGPDVNTEHNEVFPYSSQKGILFYSNDSEKETKGLDVFMAVNKFMNRWNVSKLQKPFNSKEDDFSFGILKNNIGILSSNRSGGRGGDDLYTFEYKPELLSENDQYSYYPSDTLVIGSKGVFENDNNKMLSVDPLSQLFLKEVVLIDSTKRGYLLLNKNGSFLYKNNLNESIKDSFSYRLSNSFGKSRKTWAIISPITTKKNQDVFRPIFYELDKFNIIKTYEKRLKEIVKAMNRNSKIKVKVISSTDCRGDDQYNMRLSINRTQTILNYVRERISDPERIYGIGIGEFFENENKLSDFSVIVGSFKNRINAEKEKNNLLKREIIVNIEMTKDNFYRLAINGIKTIDDAKRQLLGLNKLKIESWIFQNCYCCNLSEEEHAQNRKSIFELKTN